MIRIEIPLYETIYPEFVRISKLNALQDLKDLIVYSVNKLMKFIIPVISLLLIFTPLIINLIFGKEYLEAVNALRVVTLAGLISLSIFWINPVLLSFGKPGIRNILDIITTISYLIMLFLLVPSFSYMGAAVAYLSSTVVRISISIYALKYYIDRRKHDLPPIIGP